MTASRGLLTLWAAMLGLAPRTAAAAAFGESLEVRVAWAFAALALVVAAVLGWRNLSLHRKLDTGMADMKDLVAALNDRFTEQTEALEHANRQLHTQQQTIEDLRLTDPVTGLWSRQHVGQILASPAAQAARSWTAWCNGSAVSRPENADLLCFMVALDSMEDARTTLGPEVVEAVMRELADTLRATSRTTDVLARWEGSAFLVARSSADRRSARELAERILDSVASHVFHPAPGVEFSTTCSVGFTCHPLLIRHPDVLGWEDAVGLAERALSAARRTGRNEWVGLVGGGADSVKELPELIGESVPLLVDRGYITPITSFPEGVELRWA